MTVHRFVAAPEAGMPRPETRPPPQAVQGRDQRLDVFRGIAMLIIFVAHVHNDTWALWIPARFGFSDATEIFVFCSGLASAFAFGRLFETRGLWLGTVRVGFRVWQVYWAHIGIFLASAALLAAIDLYGWGLPGKRYVETPYIVPFFEETPRILVGLLTLRYVPGLFDILPMYLVILAMIPAVMLLHRAGGTAAVAVASALLWLAASLAGHPIAAGSGGPWLGDHGLALSAALGFLNLSAVPGTEFVWFFNPFAWQIVFFTGFAFGMGWLPVPPVSRRLVWLAAAVVLLSVPLSWYRLHEPGFYLPDPSAWQAAFAQARDALAPLHVKTWMGALRYLHFLALAYLAWVAVGPGGQRLEQPLPLAATGPRRRRIVLTVAAVLAVATGPYAYLDTVAVLAPALHDRLVGALPMPSAGQVGLLHVLHFAAVVSLLWNALPATARLWLTGAGWLRGVRVVRKVGTQSLAIFMTSIPLAIVAGLVLDWTGRGRLATALVNLTGFAILIALAYVLAWIKGHPWRRPAPHAPRGLAPAATPAE